MKKVLFVLSISFLLTSCLVIKVYESPKSTDEAPKQISSKRSMISSDMTVPFPKEGTEILFFGDEEGALPEIIHRDHDIMKFAYSSDDSTKKKAIIIKMDKDPLDEASTMQWTTKGAKQGKKMIFIAKDSLSLPFELEKAMGSNCKMDPSECAEKGDSCMHHDDRNASVGENVFIFKSKGSGEAKPLIMIDGEIQEEGYDIEAISPDDIAVINVFKGPAAIEKVGERGVNGVIMIEMKKN